MATYVNDLRLTELATGEGSGTWGTTTNTNLELIGESFSFGTEAITTNADTHTTTIADGSTDPGRSMFLKYTGTLDSACTITIGPNTVSKLWFIENATSGSQNIIISQGSGASITIANGQTKAIYSDGAGSGAAMVDAFQDLSIPDLFVDDDLTVGDDLILSSDSAIIKFGADADTTLTHTDGSGLTLNSTNKIMFNDASQFIQGSSATVLSLGATDEIDLTATAIDVNGTIDVSGNATLGGTLGVTGAVTADAGISIDNITIDGTEIDLSSGDLTIDVAGDIILDANGADVLLKDDGTQFGEFTNSSTDFVIKSSVSDKDMLFKGNDGGSAITALTLDMSAAGAATFNDKITAVGTSVFTNLDISGDIDVDGTTNLDVVDIDGAVDMASTLAVGGVVTANAGVVVDNITIDGTEIDLSSGDLTVDVAGDLLLDIDGGDIFFQDAGTTFAKIGQTSGVVGHIVLDPRSSAKGAGLLGSSVDANTGILQPVDYAGALANGAINLGTSSNRFKQLFLSSGIQDNGTASAETVFNDSGVDADFRVESNGQANMFFIDGADDAVVIGNNASRKTLFNTTATAAFQIEGTSGNTAAMSIVRNSNDDNGPQFVLGKSNGTSAGAVTVVTADALLGRISFQGADGTQTVEGARIEAFVNGTPGADDMPGRLVFSTTADGASTVTERMRIASNGGVGIGVTPTDGMDANIRYLHIGEQSIFRAGDTDYTDATVVATNLYQTGGTNKLITSGAGMSYSQQGGSHFFGSAASGSANDTVSLIDILSMTSSEVTVNEGSADIDFRVESDGHTHMLFVDAGNNKVGMGASTLDSDSILHLASTQPNIFFEDTDDSKQYRLGASSVVNLVDVSDSNKELVRFSNTANVFNEGSADIDFRVESNGNTHAFFVDAGGEFCNFFTATGASTGSNSDVGFSAFSSGQVVIQSDDSLGSGPALFLGRIGHDDGDQIQRFGTNGTGDRGNITISGGTVSYNAFMASHVTQEVPSDTLEGTVLEGTGDLLDSSIEDYVGFVEQKRLTKCKVSNTEDSPNVYGVFQVEAKSGVQYASALGAYFVRVSSSANPSLGDLLSSKGDGTAKVQDDDIIRSKTIGKVTSLQKKTTYSDGSYLLPCVLYCG